MSEKQMYVVVINQELQYSIWQADKVIPLGWDSNGFSGSKEDCLNHIEREWKDMRPLSIRS